MLVGVAAGAAVGITVVVGSGGEAGFAVASGSGVFGSNAGVAAMPLGAGVAVGLGAGVAVVHAVRAAKITKIAAVAESRDVSTEGRPFFTGFRLPFYLLAIPSLSPRVSAVSAVYMQKQVPELGIPRPGRVGVLLPLCLIPAPDFYRGLTSFRGP